MEDQVENIEEETNSNTQAVLRDVVNEIVDEEKRIQDLKVDRKQFVAEMKSRGLPTSELITVAKQDDAKVTEKSENLLKAGAILGRTVIADIAEFDKPILVGGMTELERDFAQKRTKTITEIDDEVSETRNTINKHYADLKGIGFDIQITKQMVKFKLNPKAVAAHKEKTLLMETYMTALSIVPLAEG
ncbi:GapR family DNA-binding domain-containing protein [Kiloniella sp.]|uniref:GapR family DNA-binding domain-containing protein n=1 Tax=Kiloniella sp. TaxID=1938587 RepID=UPI003B0162D6